ncbi:transmembrane amino acid transporter protein-domain-containing protein [Flagelloscypha sp. PMI_526]|nr:transmembrane amino acid transporter protein-domain-containing protein [Flagelloscypha sp. PMI_526]
MSTPARSIPIARRDSDTAASTPQGTPYLHALRAGYVGTPPVGLNIPPRSTTPRNESSSSQALGLPGSSPAISSSIPRPTIANPSPNPPISDLPAEEKAKVLRRHLVSKDERSQEGLLTTPSPAPGPSLSRKSSNSTQSAETQPKLTREETENFPVHYETPGADITPRYYKWQQDQRKANRARAVSFTGIPTAPLDPAFEHIHEPGGFRRNYVLLRSAPHEEPPRILNSFIDFLYIFGHFAGEDLEEEEDEEEEDQLLPSAEQLPQVPELDEEATEQTSLLRDNKFSRSRSRSRRRAMSASETGPHGNASVTQAVLMLLKAFIGTGVLFLGQGVFSSPLSLFTFICLVSLFSFILLVRTKYVVSGSFGDIGGALYGPWMRLLILVSVAVSQLGFVGAYTIFVAETLHSFVLGITQCATDISVHYFILMQLVILLPLALIRDLAKLSTTALIADVFILLVELFNPKDFPLFVGTAVFSFEGVGLVIPITDAMREPKRFPAVLTGVMFFLLVLFGGAGILAYFTFGNQIQTVVLVNLDTSSKMVQAVQFLYSLAILLSIPLQLFPAIRILENGVFTRSGKGDTRVKWQKNIFRFGVVLLTTVISWVGASDLDKFVAFVGCFACVPLCYVYPAMLHLKAVARTRSDRIKDYLMIVFGLLAAAYTTVQTIKLMLQPSSGEPPASSCA